MAKARRSGAKKRAPARSTAKSRAPKRGPAKGKSAARSPPKKAKPRGARPAGKSAPPPSLPEPDVPEGVVVRRTPEIDPDDPIASGGAAPLRKVWLEAARESRDEKVVVIDLVGEGRGVIAIPVAFKDEREAMAAMRPALDVLVNHVMNAGEERQQPVMVDLQELRERLDDRSEADWVADHRWLDSALADRELLCMYVFSPVYLLEFSVAIGKQQGFTVAPAVENAGFYRLGARQDGKDVEIIWNWARAIGDVIAGGHSWSYFGLLLAMAPQVAAQRGDESGTQRAAKKRSDRPRRVVG